MYNWNQFRNTPRVKDLSINEQYRQYWLYESNQSSVSNSAAGSGGGLSRSYLVLEFDDISNIPVVGSLADWNTFFFEGGSTGEPFKRISIDGSKVYLHGGYNIRIGDYLFSPGKAGNQHLISLEDTGCITEIGNNTFPNCQNLISAIFPYVTSIGQWSFDNCLSLMNISMDSLEFVDVGALTELNIESLSLPSVTSVAAYGMAWNGNIVSINLPSLSILNGNGLSWCNSLEHVYLPKCTFIAGGSFQGSRSLLELYAPVCETLGESTGDNNVFAEINNNNFTLTVPSALMTNNGGDPDGDIQYLQSNTNLTITTI